MPHRPPINVLVATPTAATPTCPWTFSLSVVKGRTLLTARIGSKVQFRVSCDRLDMQAPSGAIQATGKISLSSAGLDATSEKLTIQLQEDKVVLEGFAHVKAKRNDQELDLQADRLSLRLSTQRVIEPASHTETVEPDSD
jgi:hypothetical protein